MTPQEQQSAERAQYKINNTPLAPVPQGPEFVNTWGQVTSVQANTNDDNVTGPLSSLYRHKYALTSLKYPLDVGNRGVGKGHVVQFDISDIDPVTLKDATEKVGQIYNDFKNVLSDTTAVGVKDSVLKATENIVNNPGQVLATVVDKISNAPKLNTTPSTTKTKATIQLLMPDSLQFGYSVQYDKLSVADAAGSVPLVGSIARAITSGLKDNTAGKMGLNKLGYAFNPQEQQIFEGIDFREYEMTFTFTPISEQEANIVKQIIKTFRKHAAPTVVNKLAGFFFIPPSVFDVSFFYNGQPNYNLNAIRRSVITNIEVDYAPNGWSAFRNGAPVQTTMTISFLETELVDRASIEAEK